MEGAEAFESQEGCDVAIIGMAGRFPGAPDVGAFWQNLRAGVESVTFFSDEELAAEGFSPADLSHPNFVKAGAILGDVDLFDAEFFNIPAREAEAMDPQQRVFLECAWSALEHAGYNVGSYPGHISVYAGIGVNSYILSRLLRFSANPVELFKVILTNDKDYLATRVSYKLNLRGESVTVQTACSTSLVAVHLACQSLLGGQSDIALAGGVSIRVPQKRGYFYQEGMISSPDGHCRAFDHRAQGTLVGDGVGIVVLKLLSDALRDGDHVHAVIKGSAVNNDGHLKMGFTAPSADGQAEVIERALAMAGVGADTLSYVEAHGTGTPVGDPIEVEALTRVFRQQTGRKGFCALGAVKTNIGHLDTAAGVAGLIKTALALKHTELPPTLHFEKPNPAIDFDDSPFRVNHTLRPWPAGPTPRRAGVSSFGIGGTNAHVVLEEAPRPAPTEPCARACRLLTISARTPTALEAAAGKLADHLEGHPDEEFSDVAYTLNVGRQAFAHRRSFVAHTREEAVRVLRERGAGRVPPAVQPVGGPRVVFMFSGQGSQSVGMAQGLYESEPTFRRDVDACAESLRQPLGRDLRGLLYPAAGEREEAARQLLRPEYALPSLFTVEYALARLWMSWGVTPQALVGHSYGEYVAACLAGVFTLDEALGLSVARGRLMSRLPPGGMLAVQLSEAEARALVDGKLDVAAVNGRQSCVVAGPPAELEDLERSLAARQVGCRRLEVPYAYHSAALDPLLSEYTALVARVSRRAPTIPFVSNLTGDWIRPEQAVAADYWSQQMRRPVRFAEGLDALKKNRCGIFLEVGPSRTLHTLVRHHFGRDADVLNVASLARPASAKADDHAAVLDALGQLWCAGVEVDWAGFYRDERRRRLPLPTYPFERQRYWIEARPAQDFAAGATSAASAEPHSPREGDAAESAPPAAGEAAEAHAVRRSGPAEDYVAPRDEVEETLAAIWGDVLGLKGIGVHDDFYRLGGDSLLVTQIYSRIKQAFPCDISLRQVLTLQTIAELSPVIREQARGGAPRKAASYQPIVPVARTGDLPLSYAQQRLWFVEQFEADTAAFNIPIEFRLQGAFDVPTLERCLNEIVKRHEALRTTFPNVGGQPRQRIAPSLTLPLPVIDLRGSPEREQEARRLAKAEARRPFDLARGPLLRATLLRTGDDEHTLLLTMHHIVSDSWSIGVFLQELVALYEGMSGGGLPALPPLPIQYADFAVWQRGWLQGEVLEEQVAYWREQLAGAPPVLEVPADRPRPRELSYAGARRAFTLPAALVNDLKALCLREGATLFMGLLAGFKLLLRYYTKQSDVIVGTDIANRNRVETERLIGFFVNQLVLRTDLSGDPTFAELLRRVREVVVGAYAHQDLPFDKLVSLLRPGRDAAHTPLFQVKIVLQNVPVRANGLRGLGISAHEVDTGTAQFDLILNLLDSEQGISGDLIYRTELFEPDTITRLLANFEALLREIVARPEARLGALEGALAADEERRWEFTERELEASSLRKLRSKLVNTT